MNPEQPIDRLRELCLSLPEAHEVQAWGEPTFRVRNKLFAMYASADSHHGEGRPAVWVKAPPGDQEALIATDSTRYFRPPYVGPNGWVGAWLDEVADWDTIAEMLTDGYRMTAPKKLLSQWTNAIADR